MPVTRWTDEKTKAAMFAEINRAVRQGEVVCKDDQLVKEFKQYVYQNGKIEHAASMMTSDDSSKGKAHGDRVIAFGVALQMKLDRPSFTLNSNAKEQPAKVAHPDTMAARMQQYKIEDRMQKDDSDGWFGSVLSRD